MNEKFDDKPTDNQSSRREAIKRISVIAGGVAAAIVLPSKWTKPVMDSVISPAGAAGFISYCGTDGTAYRSHGAVIPPGSPGNNCSSSPSPSTTSF